MRTLCREVAKPFRGIPSESANQKRCTEVDERRGAVSFRRWHQGLQGKHRTHRHWSLHGISEVRPASS